MKSVLLSLACICLALHINAQNDTYVVPNMNVVEARLVQAQAENPDDIKASFELAKFYYDNATTIIQDKSSGALDGIPQVDDEIQRSLNLALPPALMAYNNGKKDKQMLNMLADLHQHLGNTEEHKAMVKELKKLNK
ncbi:MAG TPA: hypothetical protein DCX14_08110 [Flavobacteriales bacterium]|jgi:hypothetical protein|nr:hypothetical protein [Flavobacteriales bacterium]MDB9701279.1 hypothetical protein [Salibacteraceae bacterium]HAW20130.1 hypothetical protein [Flavobacteriales bacterium]